MENEIKADMGSALPGDAKLRRGMIFVVLLALVSISCICSTDNLPDFITTLIEQDDTLAADLSGTVVLLQEDFSDPGSGWEADDFDSGTVGYSQGEYVVISTDPGGAMWGMAGQNFTDVMIEVEATQVRAPSNNNNDYGVMCRLNFTGDGYSFNISGDGFYSIQIMADNQFSDLVAWTESSAINKGSATNKIQVICQSSTLVLMVNGEKLVEVIDDTYTEGDIALAATTYEDEPTEIHFDNLLVRRP